MNTYDDIITQKEIAQVVGLVFSMVIKKESSRTRIDLLNILNSLGF